MIQNPLLATWPQDQAESQPVSGTGNAGNISGNHFQTVILIKLLVMDIPQQAPGEAVCEPNA
jgi:hypothetical protein